MNQVAGAAAALGRYVRSALRAASSPEGVTVLAGVVLAGLAAAWYWSPCRRGEGFYTLPGSRNKIYDTVVAGDGRPPAPPGAESMIDGRCVSKKKRNGKCPRRSHASGGGCKTCTTAYYRKREQVNGAWKCPEGWKDTGMQWSGNAAESKVDAMQCGKTRKW